MYIAANPLRVSLHVATRSPLTPTQVGCEGLKQGIDLFDPSNLEVAKLDSYATTLISRRNLLPTWLQPHT